MNQCPKCQSARLVAGEMVGAIGGVRRLILPLFQPGGLRFWRLRLIAGVPLIGTDILPPKKEPFQACLDCGLVWAAVSKDELAGFLKKHAKGEIKRELGLP